MSKYCSLEARIIDSEVFELWYAEHIEKEVCALPTLKVALMYGRYLHTSHSTCINKTIYAA